MNYKFKYCFQIALPIRRPFIISIITSIQAKSSIDPMRQYQNDIYNLNDNNDSSSSNSQQGFPVYANVYHFWGNFNQCCNCLGLGVYHTGLQVDGVEYMYYGFDGDQTGVIGIHPKTAAYQFEEKILIGRTNYSYYRLHTQVLDPLERQFTGNQYDLLQNNCNHFARRMAEMMNIHQKFPYKVFKITNFFNLFRCCIPKCILNGRLDWFNFRSQQQHIQQQQRPDPNLYHPLEQQSTQTYKKKENAN